MAPTVIHRMEGVMGAAIHTGKDFTAKNVVTDFTAKTAAAHVVLALTTRFVRKLTVIA